MNRPRHRLWPIAATWAALLARPAAGGYTPPMDSLISDRTLSAIHDDLSSKNWDDAVGQVEAALNAPLALAKIDDRIIPLTTLVNEQLPDREARAALSAAYEKAAGGAAATALAAAVRSGDIAGIAHVAARWPWTQAAARVPAEIARQSAAVGDLSGVQSMLRLAPEAAAPLKPLASVAADSASQPVLSPVAWYNLMRPIDFARIEPVATNKAVFVASATAAAAVDSAGKLLWSIGTPPPPMKLPQNAEHMPISMQSVLFSDHALTAPAVWCDSDGVARVVVIRQSVGDASVLTARRAEDGSVLWSTADNASTRSLLMLGSPMVRGRFVYSLAIDFQPPALPHLFALGIELTSGQPLWQTRIGDATARVLGLADPRAAMGMPFVPSLIASSPLELAADDGAVYASLEGGSVVSLNRFGGALNWIAAYAAVTGDRHDLSRRQNAQDKPILHRWRDRVAIAAGVVAVAPTDSPNVVAYDAATGRRVWILDDGDGAELAGVAGGNFILAGSKLLALTPSGVTAWRVDYASAPAGPAVIAGDSIFTPTQIGVIAYAADTGKASHPPHSELLDTRVLQRQMGTQKALSGLMLIDTFLPPRQ